MNRIKKFIFAQLKGINKDCFYGQCNSGIFPRLEFEIKEIQTATDIYNRYIVTVNLYGRNTYEVIDNIADSIISLHTQKTINSERCYELYYNNDRQNIQEQDKSIRRIMLSLELRKYERRI